MLETATFAAGCFWGVEKIFSGINGIKTTIVGYTGGIAEDPSYEDVSTEKTEHVEAVQIKFNPAIISYDKLLEIFWKSHDPTTLNRQGMDMGTQYRSVVFYHSLNQKKISEESKEKLKNMKKFKNPIITEIVPATTFYKAEEYHQKYLDKA
ncbi:MAG: peptide-methionine (S)-S-oxide reductase MsrA [Parcubacteria group bacterium]|jgi:peptide-methionine (S)-S-oxide reductase